MADVSTKKAALDYARVREQRQAISTACGLLNQLSREMSTAGVKAADQIRALRDQLNEKDSQLFDDEHDLYTIISRLD